MDKKSDRQIEQKNASTAAGTQASRLQGDGPAKSMRRGARSHSEESAEEEAEESGSEEVEEEEDESEESEPSDEDPGKLRFMRRPPAASDYNADGTLKFQPKSKLLLKIDQMGDDLDGDEDDVDNSFGEEASEEEETSDEEEAEDDGEETSQARERENQAADSADGLGNDEDQEEKSDAEGSAGEGDEDEDEEEDEEDSPAPRKEKAKKPVLSKAANKKEEPPPKKKKLRKNVVNVYCTEYDVVPRSAKKIFNCKLRYYEEDHDGALNEHGEGGHKLSLDWDVSWHDLSISADFLSKMASYQKVNQYPGIYVLSRKHNLARNLMKM